MAGFGTLNMIVWPSYVGVLDVTGAEPGGDYQRGQITWETNEHNKIQGHAAIMVPKGCYTHLAYYHHPTIALTVGQQQLEHPLQFPEAGRIDLHQITSGDFTQLPTNNGYRLPV